jgi:hypothetical protein
VGGVYNAHGGAGFNRDNALPLRAPDPSQVIFAGADSTLEAMETACIPDQERSVGNRRNRLQERVPVTAHTEVPISLPAAVFSNPKATANLSL